MKKFILFVFILGIISQIGAQELLFIPCKDAKELKSFNHNTDDYVHFFGDEFVIASGQSSSNEKAIILDKNPWTSDYHYTIIYLEQDEKSNYISSLPNTTTLCYETNNFLFLKHLQGEVFPAHQDGAILITPNKAQLANSNESRLEISKNEEADPFIESLIDEIDIDGIQETIQHLENYGTRYYNKPQAFEAEQWIKEEFEALGLETEIHTFPQAGSSGNIIAIQEGTLYPDEYIVCGAHYDSYNNNQNFDEAPGADDNATGVASIIEAARILSQYEFDRSIIYCAWAAEEIGLIGSQYYAQDAAAEELDILGYFNLDMTGYLDPTQEFEFVMHYSYNSELLRDYYISMANIYYPGIPTNMSFSSWGSDYASFANNGYMGVSQNEDWSHANPHYHSPTDIIGPSVNNFEQVETYAGLNIASIASLAASLAIMPSSPENLTGFKGNQEAYLSWESLNTDILQYNIYRDAQLIQSVDPTNNMYTDIDLENETIYNYYITAIYEGEIESDPSNSVEVIPMSPISFPFFTDFEDVKANYWDFSQEWGLANNASFSPSHSLNDSPTGFYENNSETYCSLDSIFLSGSQSNYFVEFQLMHHLDINGEGDHVYFESRSSDEEVWTIMDAFSGTQASWVLKEYSLEQYTNEYVFFRFRIKTDETGQNFGCFVDDFRIDFHTSVREINNQISFYPNPSSDILNINTTTNENTATVFNNLGQIVLEVHLKQFQNQFDISSLDDGVYIIQLKNKEEHDVNLKFIKN